MDKARLPVGENQFRLTPREVQVLEMICDGKSNDEISKALDIQPETVKFHIRKLYSFFYVTKRHSVIIEAVKAGVVHPAWASAKTGRP